MWPYFSIKKCVSIHVDSNKSINTIDQIINLSEFKNYGILWNRKGISKEMDISNKRIKGNVFITVN